MSAFPRSVLAEDVQARAAEVLQELLPDLLDLGLLLKQAHWNVVGRNFRSVHEQLDDIVDRVRTATDEIAERIVTLGSPADGRAGTVASASSLPAYPEGFVSTTETIECVADRMARCGRRLREGIERLGDLDPISEDLLIAFTADLEKALWMIQAQEVANPREAAHA